MSRGWKIWDKQARKILELCKQSIIGDSGKGSEDEDTRIENWKKRQSLLRSSKT